MEELLRELIEFVKGASPELWRIALKQVMVNNITNSIVLLGSLALFALGFKIYKPVLRKMDVGDWDMGGPMLMIIVGSAQIILVIAVVDLFYKVVTGWVNPEWAAIYNLMNLVPK